MGLLSESLGQCLVARASGVVGEPVTFPVPTAYKIGWGDEVEALVAFMASAGGRFVLDHSPVSDNARQGLQVTYPVKNAQGANERRTQVEAEGTGLDEGCSVGGVLDRVGEDEGLLLLLWKVC